MPSFLIRGLARYAAASEMERRAKRRSSYTPSTDESPVEVTQLSDSTFYLWQPEMRWLLPFVQATGCKIILDNPKSREQIVIDKNTQTLPDLTLDWMQKYDRKEVDAWIAEEDERLRRKEEKEKENAIKEKTRRLAEAGARERYGSYYSLEPQHESKTAETETSGKSKNKWQKYIIPIICIYTFFILFIAIALYIIGVRVPV